MSVLRALAYRPFALLWAGQTISRFGDGLHLIALAWWVLEETGSAGAMGTVLLVATIPELLFLLLGGVAVDRLPRLRLLLASDLLRGVAVGLVAFLAWQALLAFWHVLVMAALFGLARAFFSPAYTAVIPDVLPREALPSANALRSIGEQVAGVAGPAAGGLVVALGGTPLAFAVDAATFGASAVCVAGVARLPARHRRAAPGTNALRDLREGFGTVLGSPWLWITIAIAGVSNLTLAGTTEAALPLLVREHLGAGVRAYALLNALAAAGSIVAAVWLGRQRRLRRRGRLTYGAWLVAAQMALALGLPISPIGVGAAMFVFGAAGATLGLVWTNTLQELVPSERLGRVASIDALGSYALLPAGYALAGFAADRVGPAPVFVAGGAISAGIIGLGLLHRGIRGLD